MLDRDLFTQIEQPAGLSLPVRNLRQYQVDGIESVRDVLRAGKKRVLFYLPTGAGKCLGHGTPVRMYDGSVKEVQDVRVGDQLIGPDSSPRNVLSVTRGVGPLFRVDQTKGDSYVVNDAHILSLKMTGGSKRSCGINDGSVINIPVTAYLQKSKTFKHCAKGWRVGVEFQPGAPVDIDPYFLGVWLADGRQNSPEITTGDAVIEDVVRDYAESLGLMVRSAPNSENSVHLRIVNKPGMGNPLMKRLRRYGLINDKHIPPDYLRAPRAVRLQLLAGLIDSDGWYDSKCHYLTFKCERLFDDSLTLARSLGFAAYKSKVRKTCHNNGVTGDYFSMCISGPLDQIPCRLDRRRGAPRRQKKDHLVTGIRVEPIGTGEYFGFELDGDKLFLLADFSVTHNTECAGEIFKSAAQKSKRALFVCHRIELVKNASDRFYKLGIAHGIVQGSNTRSEWSGILVCSIQTLTRRMVESAELIIVDEAHRCAASRDYHKLFARFKDIPIIGLSATPFAKGLAKEHEAIGGPLFEDIVIGATIPQLIQDGFLVDCDIYGPSEPDLSGVKIVAGDYHKEQLGEAVDQPKLVGDIVSHWQKLAGGQQTICFATNIAHSKHIAAEFAAAGIPAGHIDAYTEEWERERIIRAFRAGDITVLSNVSVLSEGWDCPSAAVMILARPTRSMILWIQMVGRILRPFDGKHRALVLDHSGTARRLGFPTDELPLELDDGKPKTSEGGGSAEKPKPLPKICAKCSFLKPPKVHICPACGFKPERQNEIEVEEGSLSKMRRGASKDMTPAHKAQFYAELKGLARERNKSQSWVLANYRAKTNEWPAPQNKNIAPTAPSQATRDWIKSRQIAWAKSKNKHDGKPVFDSTGTAAGMGT